MGQRAEDKAPFHGMAHSFPELLGSGHAQLGLLLSAVGSLLRHQNLGAELSLFLIFRIPLPNTPKPVALCFLMQEQDLAPT